MIADEVLENNENMNKVVDRRGKTLFGLRLRFELFVEILDAIISNIFVGSRTHTAIVVSFSMSRSVDCLCGA